jgi:hypothetical protein
LGKERYVSKKRKGKKRPRKSQARAQGPAQPVKPTQAAPYKFEPDYSYVVQDLKRIGLLAGTFVTLLIILSFFLR